jgi:hypothetical protein
VKLPDDVEQTMGRTRSGKYVRVFKSYAMDREVDNAFIQVPHESLPFCTLHAGMRTTEALMRPLQVSWPWNCCTPEGIKVFSEPSMSLYLLLRCIHPYRCKLDDMTTGASTFTVPDMKYVDLPTTLPLSELQNKHGC